MAQQVMPNQQIASAWTPVPVNSVIYNSVGIGACASIYGALAAARQNVPVGKPAVALGVNTSFIAFMYFGFRDCLISPVLRSQSFDIAETSPHSRGLLSSTLAGGFTRVLSHSILRRNAIVAGGIQGGLIACTLQVLLNETSLLFSRLTRSRYPQPKDGISHNRDETRPSADSPRSWRTWIIPLTRIPDNEWAQQLEDQLAEIDLSLTEVNRRIREEERKST